MSEIQYLSRKACNHSTLDHSQYVLCLWPIWAALLLQACTIFIRLICSIDGQSPGCEKDDTYSTKRQTWCHCLCSKTSPCTQMANNWLLHSMTSEFHACLICKHTGGVLFILCTSSKTVLARWQNVTYLDSDCQSHRCLSPIRYTHCRMCSNLQNINWSWDKTTTRTHQLDAVHTAAKVWQCLLIADNSCTLLCTIWDCIINLVDICARHHILF